MLARKITAAAVFIAIGVAASAAPPQKHSGPGLMDREHERHSFAINLARAVNTAEQAYKTKRGEYADWDTLLANGDFSETGTKWADESFPTVAHAMYGREPEIVPGWKLRLNVSKTGKAYNLTLEDATDSKCSYAAITDERGLIRQGRLVDCEP